MDQSDDGHLSDVQRFSSSSVLQAVSDLYAPQAAAGAGVNRRSADSFLSEFQRSEAVVPIAFGLLAGHAAGTQPLPPEAVLLLASSVRRRLQRSIPPGAPPPEEALRLASLLLQSAESGVRGRAQTQAAELVVRAAVTQWLHRGTPLPLEALISELGLSEALGAELLLETLSAFPEEANTREVRIDMTRAEVLMDLSSAAPRVMAALSSKAQQPNVSARKCLTAATNWLGVCEARADLLDGFLAASPLLSLAASQLQNGVDEVDSGGGASSSSSSKAKSGKAPPGGSRANDPVAAAADFLEALLEKSGAASACPEALVGSLLQLLASLRPAEHSARALLCNLVASATAAWRRFFVGPSAARAPPSAAWVSLLEALLACAAWGHSIAAATLPAWLGLSSHVLKAGGGVPLAYAPVLAKAARALRQASAFPADFHTWPADARDSFVEFRREFRDALRELAAQPVAAAAVAEADNSGMLDGYPTSSPSAPAKGKGRGGRKEKQRQPGEPRPALPRLPSVLLPLLLEQIQADVASQLQLQEGSWQQLEEALHALSALAKDVTEVVNSTVAAGVLQAFEVLAADGGPIMRGHRQLVSTFLQCASVYVPLFGGPGADAGLPNRLFAISRASLSLPEEVKEGPEAAFPFRSKQDHNGVVCILKMCGTFGGQEPLIFNPSAAEALRGDLKSQLAAAVAGGASEQQGSLSQHRAPLQPHSVLVLAQATGMASRASADVGRLVIADCLELALLQASAGLALQAAAEVAAGCDCEVLASALVPAWPLLADRRLDPGALAVLLARLAERLPLAALEPLARLVAQIFPARPESRAPLMAVAASLTRRTAKEVSCGPGAPPAALQQAQLMVAELLQGLAELAWKELVGADGQQPSGTGQDSSRLVARLQLVSEAAVWPPPSVANSGEAKTVAAAVLAPGERELVEAWSHLMHEAARHAPGILLLGRGAAGQGAGNSLCGFGLVLRAAVSLVAAPQDEPPVKSLALLSEVWHGNHGNELQVTPGNPTGAQHPLREHIRELLEADVLPSWPLGALQVRAVMKALLGQMPPSALGVLVPAARAVFQHGAACAGSWTQVAAGGEGFPQAATKDTTKARFLQELATGYADAQKYKQSLKRFCGGKKKLWGQEDVDE